jgi:hypothetical protein
MGNWSEGIIRKEEEEEDIQKKTKLAHKLSIVSFLLTNKVENILKFQLHFNETFICLLC